MLKKYKEKNKLTYHALAKITGVSYQELFKLVTERSPHIRYVTAMKIYATIGLQAYEYCDGLEEIKKLMKK